MKYLILLSLISCATTPEVKSDYLVRTVQGTYYCDNFVNGPYQAVGLDCEHVLYGNKEKVLYNAIEVTRVKE